MFALAATLLLALFVGWPTAVFWMLACALLRVVYMLVRTLTDRHREDLSYLGIYQVVLGLDAGSLHADKALFGLLAFLGATTALLLAGLWKVGRAIGYF
jgi:hypothetical protein